MAPSRSDPSDLRRRPGTRRARDDSPAAPYGEWSKTTSATTPTTEWGPVAIGKALHRSSGAVANALEMLVTQDVAHRTSERPKRYRLADQPESPSDTTATADDAAATVAADASAAIGLTP